VCVVNFGDEPAELARELLPDGARVVLASRPVAPGGRIPGATAVWYARD
jgi:hypothetical protein